MEEEEEEEEEGGLWGLREGGRGVVWPVDGFLIACSLD